MSRHEGVSCDACMRTNFTGLRYKCLVCYDYDLCSTCYNSGATSSRHSADHAMQCIPTKADCNIYFGGEITPAMAQVQSYTCPLCSQSGFTVTTLHEHARASHAGVLPSAVVCPICAAQAGGDPNYVTDDLSSHISLVHQSTADLRSDDHSSTAHQIRRLTHPATHTSAIGLRPPRGPTALMQFIEHTAPASASAAHGRAGSSSANISALQLGASTRDPVDPMAELLSQLSSARSRTLAAQGISLHSQLHQLELQLASTKQQLERLRHIETSRPGANGATSANNLKPVVLSVGNTTDNKLQASAVRSQFLLKRQSEKQLSEAERQKSEIQKANHSAFVQELLLSTLSLSPLSLSSNVSAPALADEEVCVQGLSEYELDTDLHHNSLSNGEHKQEHNGAVSCETDLLSATSLKRRPNTEPR